jgi:hypothetical protein
MPNKGIIHAEIDAGPQTGLIYERMCGLECEQSVSILCTDPRLIYCHLLLWAISDVVHKFLECCSAAVVQAAGS